MKLLRIIAMTATLACAAADARDLVLATTTSTENSGLLAYLLPVFEAGSGHKVRVLAAGSGQALAMARRGDADVVLVHARAEEDRFMAEGFGDQRHDVMYNDFVLVCPPSDPAGIKGGKDVISAFRRIAAGPARFVSRGDASGTEVMEQGYWQLAGAKPVASRYVSAGRGMGEVLMMASELWACTLADRATFVAYRARTGLAVMVEGDPRMANPYGVIAVNPARHPHVNHAGARALVKWLVSQEGQARIGAFRREGQQVFFPSAPVRPSINP